MNALEFYCQQEPATDAKELANLLADLPQDLPGLCAQIKQLLIHPSQLSAYRGQLHPGAGSEDGRFLTVQDMLLGLQNRHNIPLNQPHTPDQRLYVSCRYHALLLVCCLRQRQIAARVRVGFAGYVAEQHGKFVDHWIAEVWSNEEQRWLLVDPDIQRVDFPAAEFQMTGTVWQQARKHVVDANNYGMPRFWGWNYLRNNLCHDFFACLRMTPTYWDGPPLFHVEVRQLQKRHYQTLDRMAELLQNPEENLTEMWTLQANTPDLQGSQMALWAPRQALMQARTRGLQR